MPDKPQEKTKKEQALDFILLRFQAEPSSEISQASFRNDLEKVCSAKTVARALAELTEKGTLQFSVLKGGAKVYQLTDEMRSAFTPIPKEPPEKKGDKGKKEKADETPDPPDNDGPVPGCAYPECPNFKEGEQPHGYCSPECETGHNDLLKKELKEEQLRAIRAKKITPAETTGANALIKKIHYVGASMSEALAVDFLFQAAQLSEKESLDLLEYLLHFKYLEELILEHANGDKFRHIDLPRNQKDPDKTPKYLPVLKEKDPEPPAPEKKPRKRPVFKRKKKAGKKPVFKRKKKTAPTKPPKSKKPVFKKRGPGGSTISRIESVVMALADGVPETGAGATVRILGEKSDALYKKKGGASNPKEAADAARKVMAVVNAMKKHGIVRF